jgi:hypothetical protein
MPDKYDENVNGIIIGEIGFQGALFYDGKKQGPTINGFSHDEVIEKGKSALQEIKNNLGENYARVFPAPIWEVRIY